MAQHLNQPNRPHPPERMCSDLRSMQLFAEKILAYRLGKSTSEFQSFGFHEPNTDEGRQVFTIIDDRIYCFLAHINPDSIHRAFRYIEQLLDQSVDPHFSIRQVVAIGESGTVDDREQAQAAVDHYPFANLHDPVLTPSEPALEITPASTQVTLLPSASAKPCKIQTFLSYINEDPYWDPRRDKPDLATEGILQDRASAIMTWLRQQPQDGTMAHPAQFTQPPAPETMLQVSPVVHPAYLDEPLDIPSEDLTFEQDESRSRRFDGLGNNLTFLMVALAGIGLLWLLLWLTRGGLQQLLEPTSTEQRSENLIPPPPPSAESLNPTTPATGTDQAQPRSAAVNNESAQSSTKSFLVQSPANYDGVNLRVGPGENNRRIRGVPDGYSVIDEGRQIGSWREVSFQGQRGWIYRPFLR